MNRVVSVYKPIGATPLELVKSFRLKYPEYKNEKIGYAGRLDPLAHGVMLLMIGDATKERDKYLHLSKVYEFEAVFGVKTDTYDVLGLVSSSPHHDVIIDNENVNTFVNKHIGKFLQTYPPYSSKTVHGKPLFLWARNNKLAEIEMPVREIEIYKFETLRFGELAKNDFQKLVIKQINSVNGDFRQHEILKNWNALFAKASPVFKTAKFRINCSSGTYVRGLVNKLGNSLECGAVTTDILRTKVGEFGLEDAIKCSISPE